MDAFTVHCGLVVVDGYLAGRPLGATRADSSAPDVVTLAIEARIGDSLGYLVAGWAVHYRDRKLISRRQSDFRGLKLRKDSPQRVWMAS